MGMIIRGIISLAVLLFSIVGAEAALPPVALDESCIVHVLNR